MSGTRAQAVHVGEVLPARAIAVIDRVLEHHATQLGRDFAGYRNHVYRVATICALLSSPHDDADVDKIAIAAVFHDLGIWSAGTFDYLPPSIGLLTDYLASHHRSAWHAELTAMIREHHKLSAVHDAPGTLVEPFRRADLVDLSGGAFRFGLPWSAVRALYKTWPDAGFHATLARLSLRRLVAHPLNPLPMVHW